MKSPNETQEKKPMNEEQLEILEKDMNEPNEPGGSHAPADKVRSDSVMDAYNNSDFHIRRR